MKILSIETSCDDTGISILEMHGSFSARGAAPAKFGGQGSALGGKVLANSSNSQINLHIPFGGVVPMLAKREHLKNLPILLAEVLKKSKLKIASSAIRRRSGSPVDLIAVTFGPGLEPALWAGIVFAKELAQKWKVPLMPVNHMEGHIFSIFGKEKGAFKTSKLKTPILTLLVSGGHTQLVLTKKWMNYEIIGETLDDAVGEAFDKVARMLGLPYPGGPQISKLAERERKCIIPLLRGGSLARRGGYPPPSDPGRSTPQEENLKFSLPRPMLHSKNFDFSFSGLKTAVLYLIRDLGGIEKISPATKAQIALEFENAAIECLVHKTQKALEKYKIKTLIVAGGVAANQYLKNEMQKLRGKTPTERSCLSVIFPAKGLHGDNSIMIGIAGYFNYIKLARRGGNKKKIPKINNLKATGNLRL